MTTQVTIVGAGPYGLSLAAHLQAQGTPYRIIGTTMDFWKSSMPQGMMLKSDGLASSLYEPTNSFPLSRYCVEQGIPYADIGIPVTLETFTSYALEFQRRFVPKVEHSVVTSVQPDANGFLLTLDNGETFTTQKLVLAVGVGCFKYVPQELSSLSQDFVTHSSEHADLTPFANGDVAIVGAGASAVDLAALLHQNGARPVVIARRPRFEFHDRPSFPRTLRARILKPSSCTGPGWRSWFFCNAPQIFHRMPERWRLKVTRGHLGPAGGWFIRDAVVGKIPLVTNATVKDAVVENNRVRLSVYTDDSAPQTMVFDHVIAATGFRVDVDRLSFLDESLRARISCVEKTPILSSNFESSVPGLFLVGLAAANSFGPVQRFAFGAKFAARRLSRTLA